MGSNLIAKDPRDRVWRPVGLKIPTWMVDVLDAESCRLHWDSRNRLVVELLKPWALEQEAKKKAKAK
jgi:hypothetical protein